MRPTARVRRSEAVEVAIVRGGRWPLRPVEWRENYATATWARGCISQSFEAMTKASDLEVADFDDLTGARL